MFISLIMNEVIKNTHAFVDILSMARGDAVQTWDEGTLQRAFKWAQYFEEVYHKLKSKPALAEKLNKYIGNFNKTRTVYLGTLQLSFSKLEHSKEILRNCLLQNPHINNPQFGHVLRLYGIKLGSWNDAENVRTLEQDVTKVMQQKGILSILSQMRDMFTKNMQDEIDNNELSHTHISYSYGGEVTGSLQEYHCGESKNIALTSGGQLLFKYILHFLESSEKKDTGAMHEKLRIISTQEDGINLITLCLLCIPEDCQSHSKADNVQTFIVDWLSGSLSSENDHPFWSLPPLMLSTISIKYESILDHYLSRLISWANIMSPVLTCQLSNEERKTVAKKLYVWRSPEGFSSSLTTKTFDDHGSSTVESTDALDTLYLHFKCLTSGPIHIQELCYQRIEKQFSKHNISEQSNMKDQRGKHFVQKDKLGVNVWWDLYCQLKSST